MNRTASEDTNEEFLPIGIYLLNVSNRNNSSFFNVDFDRYSLSVSGRVNDSHTTPVCVNKAKRIGYSGAKFLVHLVKTFGPLVHHEKKLCTS